MIRNIFKLNSALFSNASKIPRPRDPAIPESFETKLTD